MNPAVKRSSSPPYPAKDYSGKTKKGNDGKMYKSVPNKHGVCKWQKVVKGGGIFWNTEREQCEINGYNKCYKLFENTDRKDQQIKNKIQIGEVVPILLNAINTINEDPQKIKQCIDEIVGLLEKKYKETINPYNVFLKIYDVESNPQKAVVFEAMYDWYHPRTLEINKNPINAEYVTSVYNSLTYYKNYYDMNTIENRSYYTNDEEIKRLEYIMYCLATIFKGVNLLFEDFEDWQHNYKLFASDIFLNFVSNSIKDTHEKTVPQNEIITLDANVPEKLVVLLENVKEHNLYLYLCLYYYSFLRQVNFKKNNQSKKIKESTFNAIMLNNVKNVFSAGLIADPIYIINIIVAINNLTYNDPVYPERIRIKIEKALPSIINSVVQSITFNKYSEDFEEYYSKIVLDNDISKCLEYCNWCLQFKPKNIDDDSMIAHVFFYMKLFNSVLTNYNKDTSIADNLEIGLFKKCKSVILVNKFKNGLNDDASTFNELIKIFMFCEKKHTLKRTALANEYTRSSSDPKLPSILIDKFVNLYLYDEIMTIENLVNRYIELLNDYKALALETDTDHLGIFEFINLLFKNSSGDPDVQSLWGEEKGGPDIFVFHMFFLVFEISARSKTGKGGSPHPTILYNSHRYRVHIDSKRKYIRVKGARVYLSDMKKGGEAQIPKNPEYVLYKNRRYRVTLRKGAESIRVNKVVVPLSSIKGQYKKVPFFLKLKAERV